VVSRPALPPPPTVHARRQWSRSAPPAVLGHQPRGRIACLRQRRHRLPGSAAVCGGALHWGESVQLLGGAAGRGRLGGPVLVLPQSGDRVGQRTQLGEQREQLLVLAPADEPGGRHRHGGGA
jgi:hypothetical protein